MALVKTIIPYEIMIRFNWGHMPGKLGDYAGAHFIEAEVINDDQTGEVINIKPGQARPLEREKVEAYIGTAILNVDQQMQEMRDALDTATAQRDSLIAKGNDLIAEIEARKAMNEEMLAHIARLQAAAGSTSPAAPESQEQA